MKKAPNPPIAYGICLSLSSLILLASALMYCIRPTAYGLLVTIGMAFSFLGDISLSRAPIARRLKDAFLVGMGFFMIGHAFYLSAYITSAFSPGVFLLAWFAIGAICTLLWLRWMYRHDHPNPFTQYGSLVYLWWICAMVAATFGMGLANGGWRWLAFAGGVLFIISDGVLGAHVIGEREVPYADRIVWASYAPAQLLIILSQLS